MVDFSKLLGERIFEKKINPIEIYDSLDRTSDTSELRKSQQAILEEWWTHRRGDKDVILKLHTGQGKTLIGLLILQSKLNEQDKPCIYVCPNKYLVEQTCEQAKKFGISYVTFGVDKNFPEEFINGKKILITHVQKVFNGLSIFGTGNRSINVSTIILDDSHACIESIKNSYTIRLNNEHDIYKKVIGLFEDELKAQGSGKYYEIASGESSSVLNVPYWAWADKYEEITKLLSDYRDNDEIKFAWALIKDEIKNCQCFISGHELEIIPYVNQIHKFGTFNNAFQRIFMSATTQNDSFFIKGLGVNAEAVKAPLKYDKEKWSGEKMILIPSLIHHELDRELIITKFAGSNNSRKFGVVALTNSFRKSDIYKQQGSVVADKERIYESVRNLKLGNVQSTLVIVNRYDGIDLPDDSCRILIIDSKPYAESLDERYEEYARADSDVINIRVAQKIEQGLGRSVRGEKDFSVIIMIGEDLVKYISSIQSKRFFSNQTQRQIEIGKEVCRNAREELSETENHFTVIQKVIEQSLIKRDEGWKRYYSAMMDYMSSEEYSNEMIDILELEKKAENNFVRGEVGKAISTIQEIIDRIEDEAEKGWYLQVLARYKFFVSKAESLRIQQSAFKHNTNLLKPREGIDYSKISFINEDRIAKIKNWLRLKGSYPEILLSTNEALDGFSFGSDADIFERALQTIGEILGFISQRPDKEFKEGPDNLWCVGLNDYLLFECKSEVLESRKEISFSEVAQMDKHTSWFKRTYNGCEVKRILIIQTINVTDKAFFSENVGVMRKNTLNTLKKNIKSFVKEFESYDITNLTNERIHDWLSLHKLDVMHLKTNYIESPKQRR